jgi:hypothetical protein
MQIKADKRPRVHPHDKFTPERVNKILADIGEYVPYKIAAEANGIHIDTFKEWLLQGVFDLKHGIESEHAKMASSLRNIEMNKIKENTGKIGKGKYGHKGSEWLLERVFWKYFTQSAADKEFEERLSALEGTEKDKENKPDKDKSNANKK